MSKIKQQNKAKRNFKHIFIDKMFDNSKKYFIFAAEKEKY